MTNSVSGREARRLAIQAELDAARNQADRNRMGQFATPTELAVEMLRYAKTELDDTTPVRFIDPAIGTGSFYSALLRVFPDDQVTDAVGYEIDPHYGQPATRLWQGTALDLRLEDFTLASVPSDRGRFNLLICNPPYVRHHHIAGQAKKQLKALAWKAGGIEVNGLAGLYCYFVGLAHPWMVDGGLAGWLIPSEFMDVNYGASVKRYLLERVTLLHIHRFDPHAVQFQDALVSSVVVWFRKQAPPPGHRVRMTFGGSQLKPALERWVPADTLRDDPKWTRYPMKEGHARLRQPVLADFFTIKRGLVTGGNSYFILSGEEIGRRGLPPEMFQPILPGPRYLPANEVLADESGHPRLERKLFLLNCRLEEEVVKDRYPKLWDYLLEGREQGIPDRYTCRNRSPWYAQERRPATPFLCTYIGRSDKKGGRPFRFLLNHSHATAPNVYLMLYPKGGLAKALTTSPQLKFLVWDLLNGIDPGQMLNEGRVYGGGLHKLEPKELGRVQVPALAKFLSQRVDAGEQQLGLFESAPS